VLQLLGLRQQRQQQQQLQPASPAAAPAPQPYTTPAQRTLGAAATAVERTPAVPAAPAVGRPGPSRAAAGAAGDMAFFLQLQGGPAATREAEAAAEQQPRADSQGVSADDPDGAAAMPQEVQVGLLLGHRWLPADDCINRGGWRSGADHVRH
jgi:hypothetical protein